MVDFIIRHLEVPEIYNYLAENDQMFKPPMSARLNILNYAKKLNAFAVHFCAYQESDLVGFSGCYFNNMETRVGFISTLSVIRKFQGMGVAKGLLTSIEEYATKKEFNQINLQAFIFNLSAIKLYSESGFIEISRNASLAEMSLNLKHSIK
jgi:ribosomal protein S18 acetylase RimI-like enzyme